MDPNSISTIVQGTDWGLVSTVVQIIASVTTCLLMIVTAGVAIYGITAWRREFRGKRQMELAEEVLALFYEAKDAILAIRSPWGFAGEGSTRKPTEGETEQEKKFKDRAYSVWERYEKHQAVFNKLHSMRYRFMAQIGKKAAEPFEHVRKIVNEILSTAGMVDELWVERASYCNPEEKKELSKEIKRYEAIIWWSGSKDDIDKQVEEIISQIEETCRPIIMKARGRGLI